MVTQTYPIRESLGDDLIKKIKKNSVLQCFNIKRLLNQLRLAHRSRMPDSKGETPLNQGFASPKDGSNGFDLTIP